MAELTAAHARADLADANEALQDLGAAGATMRARTDEFADIQSTLGAKLDAIRKELKNAGPLPVDCPLLLAGSAESCRQDGPSVEKYIVPGASHPTVTHRACPGRQLLVAQQVTASTSNTQILSNVTRQE
ncbi:hypothetical protein [Cupriavidus sp. CuC1]|uniref:hypothetical protein n=1 Tax=Cupriavidus sp. CuC1 TaxID=3373131 RepID=UPI0037D821E4